MSFKKRIKQVNKVPQVILEISIGGVNVLDATTNVNFYFTLFEFSLAIDSST